MPGFGKYRYMLFYKEKPAPYSLYLLNSIGANRSMYVAGMVEQDEDVMITAGGGIQGGAALSVTSAEWGRNQRIAKKKCVGKQKMAGGE